MTEILKQLSEILMSPFASLFLILNICFIETILSIDNASVLALMVKKLKPEDQKKALRYGIIGAYLFRGLSLVFVSFVISIWWIKPLAGLYLLYLTYKYFKGKSTETTEDDLFIEPENGWFYKHIVNKIGTLWATIIAIEFADLSLSIDNIFAVVAYTPNKIMICIGVFVGILAMRFVAQKFVVLMEKFTFLETCAYVVIGVLGIKLFSSLAVHFWPMELKWIESETFDLIMSAVTILIFVVPILYNKIFKGSDDVEEIKSTTKSVVTEIK